MNIVFIAVLALAAAPAQLDTSATPTTRLFVRTVPHGATVTVDGEPIGKSDGLFQILPGSREIAVELDGYAPETREIEVFKGRITKICIELQEQSHVKARTTPRSAPAGTSNRQDVPVEMAGPAQTPAQGSGGSDAASAFVSQGDFSASTRQAMLTVLHQHPGESRWAGRDGNRLFGMAVKPLPQTEFRTRTVPAMLELVQARELMARSAWADALLLWQHLHQRQLVSQQLYLDAARCFQRLDQAPDAARVLSEAIETFAKSGTAEFFEQAGDLALEIQTEAAETLAERAYQRAIDTLRDTVSGPENSPDNDLGNKTP